MNEVFADTSGWASFFREQERHHARAVALMTQWQEENRHVVTTNYVLGELIALCERLRVPRSRGFLISTAFAPRRGSKSYI